MHLLKDNIRPKFYLGLYKFDLDLQNFDLGLYKFDVCPY